VRRCHRACRRSPGGGTQCPHDELGERLFLQHCHILQGYLQGKGFGVGTGLQVLVYLDFLSVRSGGGFLGMGAAIVSTGVACGVATTVSISI
jgi:hypothetical protein